MPLRSFVELRRHRFGVGNHRLEAYRAVELMSRTALAAVSQTPTGANAHRLIVVTRYTTKSTGCYATLGFTEFG
jgi:hypothetical protein